MKPVKNIKNQLYTKQQRVVKRKKKIYKLYEKHQKGNKIPEKYDAL